MDLYQIGSSLRKPFSERPSHFRRADVTSEVPHHNDLSKFPSNDLLSSSAWSAVIHQPDQDSDPEDLPSTVDIDAIKEPPTPINASAQTPVGQLHGDSHSFELSDEQNAGDSASDSDSDSESGNSENENAASGGDSGSSDSDSASSHPSSSSSKGKPQSSRSSRSNSPPSAYADKQQQFSVRETNFEQGGLKLRISALRGSKQKYDLGDSENVDVSSDSSESKSAWDKKKLKFDSRLKNRKLHSLKSRNDCKSKLSYFSKDRLKCGNSNDKETDSDSSSSSNTSPEKSYVPWNAKTRIPLKSNFKLDASVNRSKAPNVDSKNHPAVREDKNDRLGNHLANKRTEISRNSSLNTKESGTSPSMPTHSRYRGLNKASFNLPSLKLPQSCKLSEDSDESLDNTKVGSRSNVKKDNSRDTIEKLAQQLTQPGTTSDQLQVLNEEDLAAVLPDVEGTTSGGGEFELTDGSTGKRKLRPAVESKKAVSSDSSSDTELFPKQKQIVRDAINSICVDSEASNASANFNRKCQTSEDDSSSSEEEERNKRKDKGQYSSNLLEAFAEQTDRLNRNTVGGKSKSTKTTSNVPSANKKGRNEVVRKRGRPPKSKLSSMAEIEAYMRLDCTVSNVSPDSGIQSNAGSPLYHSLQSPAIFNKNSRAASTSNKLSSVASNKSLSLSQKAVLSASKKSSHKGHLSKVPPESTKMLDKQMLKNAEKKSALALKQPAQLKLNNVTKTSPYSNTKVQPTPPINADPVMHSDLTLFQGKRGPGRPKKIVPPTVNGKTKSDKNMPLEMDGPFEKVCDRPPKPVLATASNDKVKSKKMKYRSPVAMCLEGRKKRRKKKPIPTPVVTYQPLVKPCVPSAAPHFPTRKEWLHKHKKRKKKDSKEKSINLELLKLVDELVDVFNKKLVIEDRKSSKIVHRVKEKSKKKKHTEKMKHSDNDSEYETASPLSVAASVTSSKRRHKKSAIETPKVLETNSDQRLPLKKRHYHVSASSITSNNHQTHSESKNRSEKHSHAHSSDAISSSPATTSESTSKTNVKSSVPKISDNLKSKSDSQKTSVKLDSQKNVSKSETCKSNVKSDSSKNSTKHDSHKNHSKSDTAKHSSKSDNHKNVMKTESKKVSSKPDTTKVHKHESSKAKVEDSKNKSDITENTEKIETDNIPVTPKKRHRLEEENKIKNELLPFLPLRRSGRKKADSPSPEAKSKTDGKTVSSHKKKNEVEVDPVPERTNTKRNSRQNYGTNSGKRSDSSASKNSSSSRNDSGEKSSSSGTNSKSDHSKKEKVEEIKESSSSSSDVESSSTESQKDTNEGSTLTSSNVSAVSTPTKLQSINKPQLITPLPSEPIPVNTSVNLKPPAGVFEPSRKLPSSLSKCKKTSIADVLSKLQEKLKDLDSPLKNTSALIEKIGVAKNETDPNTERNLRSKRTNAESESISAKKSRICKDMSIRLRKLSSTEIANSGATTTELKPKLKRRKTINRTGFPVKKKKKRIKTSSDAHIDTGEETNVESTTEDEKTDELSIKTLNSLTLPKVKNELIEEQSNKNENIENKPPNLRPIDNTTVKVKSEVMSEDEITRSNEIRSAKNKKKVKSDVPSRLTPSRCSARIYIKQQIRAREMKKSKKKTGKKSKIKKTFKIGTATVEKIQKEVAGKVLRPRECKIKEGDKADTSKEIHSKHDNDKETKSRDETDIREELSDSDSVKCQILKKVDVPKWKKKYFSAGLFSEFYKEEKHAAADAKNRSNYKEEDHPHGLLPPPPYFEDWVRHRKVNFKLPFDLWWLHSHNQLPGRDDVVPSWNYKKIRTNVYYDVKPTYMYEAQACNCKVPTEKDKLGCGEDCINRLVYAECSPQLCPLKQKCSNQKIQKHEWASKLVKFMTQDKGWGVKTKEPIKNGDFIMEYVGEVVSDREFKKRMTSLYKNDTHHYCLNLDGGLLIDGHRMGGAGRFVNHSCEPNCEMQKWSVNGLFRMALFALRDIEAGEELTYDYNFALFNPAEGQPCLCGSCKCRGVIGGKSQRVAVSNVGSASNSDATSLNAVNQASNSSDKKSNRMRPRKQIRKTVPVTNIDSNQNQRRDSVASSNSVGILPQRNMYNLTPVRQLTPEEKKTVVNFRVFLIRNLIKIQRFREKLQQIYNNKENSNCLNQNGNKIEDTAAKESAVFLTQLNALSTQRFIRTRRLAQAQDNPEMTKTAQLANVFRTIYSDVVSAKDEKGEPFSSLFMTLPSKRKLPMYYQRIGDPIDLTTIERNIVTGVYKNVELFDRDVNKLIMNNVKYYGRTSDYGIAAVRLRKEYNIAKLNYVSQIKEIIGETIPPSFMPGQEDPGDEEEDVIRCICGLYNDEGLMIQCERCLVWQHCDCVKADTNAEHYLCERCNPRDVDYEIPLDILPDYANPGEKHHLTLMRDDLQIRQGDTVYVLRDIFNPETGTRHSFRTIKNFKFEDCDIFRVERLWKNEKGDRFSFGHHYLRPHETFHEPTRKFYPNEVVKVPLYETVPLDLIMGQCYVLDIHTYRKGRPIDSDPEHMYICEFRVDKAARLFYKLPKSKQYAVCTKNYAFDKYDTPLKPSRTYAPHGEVKPSTVASTSTVSKPQMSNHKIRHPKSDESVVNSSENGRMLMDSGMENSSCSIKTDEDDLPLSHLKDSKLDKQKQRLNTILLKLLAKKSSAKTLDASYLLDLGRRNRKKPDHFTT